MTTFASVRRLCCSHCGDRLIAPEASEFVSEEEVRHHWNCARCGNEFETTIWISHRAVDPSMIEHFLPSLVVA